MYKQTPESSKYSLAFATALPMLSHYIRTFKTEIVKADSGKYYLLFPNIFHSQGDRHNQCPTSSTST